MKAIGISGHSSGIGEAAYELLSSRGWKCHGFSRRNGFDLSDPDQVRQMLDTVERECDVFVNNAHVADRRDSQLEILDELWARWKNDPTKTIIVNSSLMPAYVEYAATTKVPAEYIESKKRLIERCRRIFWSEARCRVVNLMFGAVDTPLTRGIQVSKMSPRDAAEAILLAIDQSSIFELVWKR